ncbi:retrotransposon-related protein [Tanacetum coccineum]|uniref:Retrotransposon-related protein n=1 Tax=Tanacetum coccineum TaxID=301880 RepID=A0ABQ5HVT7_9ASTR
MRLDVPKFNGSDPDTWILAINEYFSLLETTPEQRLRIIGFIMEGDATDWYRWMTHNKLVTSWEDFLESVRSRFGPSKYDDPQGALFKLLQTGEAFSLARVTEARLEDQWPASAIAKTHDIITVVQTNNPTPSQWISPKERQERLNQSHMKCGTLRYGNAKRVRGSRGP